MCMPALARNTSIQGVTVAYCIANYVTVAYCIPNYITRSMLRVCFSHFPACSNILPWIKDFMVSVCL